MSPVVDFALKRSDGGTNPEAIAALRAIGDPAYFEACLDAFCARFSAGEMQDASSRSGRSLAQSDPRRASEVLEKHIRPALNSSPLSAEHRRAIAAISWLPSTDALALFRKLWPDSKTDQAREALLDLLFGSINVPEATALMLDLYSQIPAEAGFLRSTAIERFGKELYEPAIPVLGAALADVEGYVRNAARTASEEFKQQRQALEEFQAWTTASKAARDSIDELKDLLADPNRDVVLGAVKALGVVKARTALPELVKLLGRDDAELKQAVQTTIDRIGE